MVDRQPNFSPIMGSEAVDPILTPPRVDLEAAVTLPPGLNEAPEPKSMTEARQQHEIGLTLLRDELGTQIVDEVRRAG